MRMLDRLSACRTQEAESKSDQIPKAVVGAKDNPPVLAAAISMGAGTTSISWVCQTSR